jgi:hypothetical protein
MSLIIKTTPDNEYTTDNSGVYSLNTGGTVCENNIVINTNMAIYEVPRGERNGTSAWYYLVQLDAGVLQHIDDPNLIVSCSRIDEFEYEGYDSSICIASNTPWGSRGGLPFYGMSLRANHSGEDTYLTSTGPVYVPANNREINPPNMEEINGTQHWSFSQFRVDGLGNYYIKGSDGYVHSGMYRLIFQW